MIVLQILRHHQIQYLESDLDISSDVRLFQTQCSLRFLEQVKNSVKGQVTAHNRHQHRHMNA
jgi:hypothetical protein